MVGGAARRPRSWPAASSTASRRSLVKDIKDEIAAADAQIAELDKKIQQGRAAERKLPQFREEVKRLELELEKLRRILPSTRNTEEIIKKIKSLVDQGEFTLRRLTFPPLARERRAIRTSEWPISVARRRPLSRPGDPLQSPRQLLAHHERREHQHQRAGEARRRRRSRRDFVAKTFVYVEPAEEKPAGDGEAKPGGSMSEEDDERRAIRSLARCIVIAGRSPACVAQTPAHGHRHRRHGRDDDRVGRAEDARGDPRRAGRRPTRIATTRRDAAIRSARSSDRRRSSSRAASGRACRVPHRRDEAAGHLQDARRA